MDEEPQLAATPGPELQAAESHDLPPAETPTGDDDEPFQQLPQEQHPSNDLDAPAALQQFLAADGTVAPTASTDPASDLPPALQLASQAITTALLIQPTNTNDATHNGSDSAEMRNGGTVTQVGSGG